MKHLCLCLVSIVFLLVFSKSLALADDGVNSQKLDQVLQNQKEILQKLDEVKAELQIVKIRATNK